MARNDPRIDAYIERSADFAKPILRHIRKLIHTACPEIQETIKWSIASFDYKGPFCSMAAFKGHCIFGFWKATLIPDPSGILTEKKNDAMGSLGRITSLEDLPSDNVIIEFIKAAKKLNDEGTKLPARIKIAPTTTIEVPDYFQKLLQKNKKALQVFEAFSYSHKKEYLEWITEAKTEDTRNKRMATTIEWLTEGKSRNWKYMKK